MTFRARMNMREQHCLEYALELLEKDVIRQWHDDEIGVDGRESALNAIAGIKTKLDEA